jgi:hypothetical protein
MTKLMTGVSAIALAAMFALPTQAQTVVATASAGNGGTVAGNNLDLGNDYTYWSSATADINSNTADGARGIVQMNQNAGNNSLLQNSTALAYIVAVIGGDTALAGAGNGGFVTGNWSQAYFSSSSASISGSFDDTVGLVNVNQNAGENSLLQNATAIAVLVDCSNCDGDLDKNPLTYTAAGASNSGTVQGNNTYSIYNSASATISASFNDSRGVIQVNQNAGANSGLQNATAIGFIEARLGNNDSVAGVDNDVAIAIANAGNVGLVIGSGNTSIRSGSSASATIRDSSFDGSDGVINVNQNAGDNSLLQNATAIAALIDCACDDRKLGSPETLAVPANANNFGTVNDNYAYSGYYYWGSSASATISTSFDDMQGVVQVNQNAGANSLLQNATAIAYIETAVGGDPTIAVAVNDGSVLGNSSVRYGYDRWHRTSNTASIDQSFDDVQGVLNVNQNAGDNSLLQNATAISALIDCGNCDATLPVSPTTSATADVDNKGNVIGNHAYSSWTTSSASITDSFNGGTQGVIQVNQNAGANSNLQNATAVAYLDGRLGDDAGNNDAVSVNATATGNLGFVLGNSSSRWNSDNSASIDGSFTGIKGIVNVNQNAGDNSLLQNATALAALIDCNCRPGTDPDEDVDSAAVVASASNIGTVSGNGAYTGSAYSWSWNSAHATISNSFNGASGVIQVNQNVGANSLLQNAAAVGYVRGRFDPDTDASTASTVATAVNVGTVGGNTSRRWNASNSATIRGSFNRATGVTNVNQNAGDNSMLQNSTALATIQYCGPRCISADLTSVAVASNVGIVAGNHASSVGSSASATISGSFQGHTGLLNVNQNAGANSQLQNSIAVGVILPSSSNSAYSPVTPLAPLAPANPIR